MGGKLIHTEVMLSILGSSWCVHAHMWVLSEYKTVFTDTVGLSSQHLLRICKAKALMTLILHTQTHTCTWSQHPHPLTHTHHFFPLSVCMHYAMERVVRGSMASGNLISHCDRMAYIKSSGTEWGSESKGWREREKLETWMLDGFRMMWSLENSKRLIYGGPSDREGGMKSADERREWWTDSAPQRSSQESY